MRRLVLLVTVVCALLWAAGGSTRAVSADHAAVPPDAASSLVADDGPVPGDSDAHWRAQHHSSAAVTESGWKSAPVHAALAAARSALAPAAPLRGAAAAPPVRPAPHYLRHTPLLI